MKNLGRISLILLAIFFVSSVIAIATGPVLLFNGFETASINQHSSMSMEGINKLSIDVSDPNVNVYPIKGDDFDVNLSGSYAKNKYEYSINLSVEKLGDELLIRVLYPNQHLILINKNLKIDVGIPYNYSGDLSLLSVSGNINAANIDSYGLYVKSTSGNINLQKIENYGESSAKSVSGNINIKDLKTDYGNFKSTSGEIKIINSGNIDSADTVSGDIEIRGYNPKSDASFESTSGEISLYMEKTSSAEINFKSTSGDLNNNFGDIVNGEYKINIKTVSGDLNIY